MQVNEHTAVCVWGDDVHTNLEFQYAVFKKQNTAK